MWFHAKISCDELWIKDRGVLAKRSVNLKAIRKELEGIVQKKAGTIWYHLRSVCISEGALFFDLKMLLCHLSGGDEIGYGDSYILWIWRLGGFSEADYSDIFFPHFIHIVFSPLCISHSTDASHFTPFRGYGCKLKNILCGAYNHPFAASDVLPRRAIVSVATSARKDNFKRSLEEFIQNQTIDDQGRPIQPSQEEIMDMWIKAVDGVHKGRVYGLGSEFSLGCRTSGLSVSYSFPDCSVDLDEFEQLNRKVEKITELYLQ
uniref:Uncharacterized protein n=1 Tax=Nicotiana tabacum TaxID=4097 RepID=A0A1S3Z606_TOBAC|nr:PREDICTED: uncharacterized protein LOC107783377 [Nicotiana tabacum]